MIFDPIGDLSEYLLSLLFVLFTGFSFTFICGHKPDKDKKGEKSLASVGKSTSQGRQHKPYGRGKELGVQIDAQELVHRYGKEQGTQLVKGSNSLAELTAEKKKVNEAPPQQIETCDVRLLSQIFAGIGGDKRIFEDLPVELHPHLKLLRIVGAFYQPGLAGVVIDHEGYQNHVNTLMAQQGITEEKYLKMLDELAVQYKDDPKKLEAIKLLKEAWLAKRMLTEEEMQKVMEAFATEVVLTPEALQHLLDLLMQNGVISKEEKAKYFEELKGKEKITVLDLMKVMHPEMYVEQGGSLVSRTRLQELLPLIQIMLAGEVAYAQQADPKIAAGLTEEERQKAALLHLIKILYTHPGFFEAAPGKMPMEPANVPGFDVQQYEKLLVALPTNDNPQKETAKTLLKESWANKRALTVDELGQVFLAYGSDIAMDWDKFQQLLAVLAANGLITNEDIKDFNNKLTPGQEVAMKDLMRVMTPEMRINDGMVMSRRRIEEMSPLQKILVTAMICDIALKDPKEAEKMKEEQKALANLLKLLAALYTSPGFLEAAPGPMPKDQKTVKNFDEALFQKSLAGVKTNKDPKKEAALKIVKESQANKRALTLDELKQIFDAFDSDVPVGGDALENLLKLLMDAQMIGEADRKLINDRAKCRQPATLEQIVHAVNPQMTMNTGGQIAARRKIEAPPPPKKIVKVDTAPKTEKSGRGFFGAAPEDDMDNAEIWRDAHISGDMVAALLAGSSTPDHEHHAVLKGEHPLAGALMTELAQDFVQAKQFEAKAGGQRGPNQSMKSVTELMSTADPYTMKSSMMNKSMKGGAGASTRSQAPATFKDVGANREKYKQLIEKASKDPEFMKDPEKRAALDLLKRAVEKDQALTVEEIEKVMTAMGKGIILTPAAQKKLLDKLIASGDLTKEKSLEIMAELKQAQAQNRGLLTTEVHKIVAKHMKIKQPASKAGGSSVKTKAASVKSKAGSSSVKSKGGGSKMGQVSRPVKSVTKSVTKSKKSVKSKSKKA